MEKMIGKKYRHFKGHIYEVIAIAKDSETVKDMVVYQNVETKEVWVRPYEMFISKVDKNKYSNVLQEYRFEEI